MNIVLIRSNPVKPCPRTEKMARCLLKNGHKVTVLAWDREYDYSPREEQLELGNMSCGIVRIGLKGQFGGGVKKNLVSLLRFQLFIYKWLKSNREKYDVVHAYDLDTGLISHIVTKKLQKLFIYDIADYYSNGHGYTGILCSICNYIENQVIDKAFAVIICTEERKNEIKGTHPKRLYVIHNTPDILVEPYEMSEHNRVRLAYIGIFGKTRFLTQLTEFVAYRSDLELHIGGFGGNMEPYFEKMAREHDNIVYYGRTPYNKTIEIEKKCDILPIIYDPALLNHVYAAPNKFYEALALGKPMIMAKGTGMSSVVEEYGIGETIEYTVESLEQAIKRLIDKKESWSVIGKKEQELYEIVYSWREMERRINKLYSEIADHI